LNFQDIPPTTNLDELNIQDIPLPPNIDELIMLPVDMFDEMHELEYRENVDNFNVQLQN
jgi:hypothetical protein